MVFVTIGMVAVGSAQVAEDDWDGDDTDVTVEVSEVTELDVQPNNMAFENIQPGERLETSTDDPFGFSEIAVENVGSTNINQLWAESTTPNERTFGSTLGDGESGEDIGFDTGNFFQIGIEAEEETLTGTDQYRFINRIEYMEENNPPFINVEDGGETAVVGGDADQDEAAIGRFRNGDQEYYWAIGVDTPDDSTADTSLCDGTGTKDIAVAENERTVGSDLGTTDFTTQDNVVTSSIEDLNGDSDVGIATSVPIGDATYDLLIKCESDGEGDLITGTDSADDREGTWVMKTRYNMDPDILSDGAELSSSSGTNEFLLDAGTDQGAMLSPGETSTVNTAVQVPQGVAQGQISSGSVKFYATQESSDFDNVDDLNSGD